MELGVVVKEPGEVTARFGLRSLANESGPRDRHGLVVLLRHSELTGQALQSRAGELDGGVPPHPARLKVDDPHMVEMGELAQLTA